MAVKDEIYLELQEEIRPALDALTKAVNEAIASMNGGGGGVSSSEITLKVKDALEEFKDSLEQGATSVALAESATRLEGLSLEQIKEQILNSTKEYIEANIAIDDDVASKTSVYSSQKVDELMALNVELDDTDTSDLKSWSSAKISAEIAKAALSGVDDEKIKELIKESGGGIDEDALNELIAQATASKVDEAKVNELIAGAQLSSSGVDVDKLNELIAQATASKVDEARVNELITGAQLSSGGVDEGKLSELIIKEIEKNNSSALSEERVNELITQALRNFNPSTPSQNQGQLEEVVIYE